MSPTGLKAELPGRSWVRLSGMSRGAKQKWVGAGVGLPSPPPGNQQQLEALGLGPAQGRADRTAGQMMGLTFPVRWKPENTGFLQR